MKYSFLLACLLLGTLLLSAQKKSATGSSSEVPFVYSNIVVNESGELVFMPISSGNDGKLTEKQTFLTLENIRITPESAETGLVFNFNNEEFNGTIYYGMFANEKLKYPQPVYFRKSAKITKGKAEIDVAGLSGKYDIAGLEKTGWAKLGYRITNTFGDILYNGRLNVEGKGPFSVGLSIVEGPFVNNVSGQEAVISFTTNMPCSPVIEINERQFHAVQMMGNPIGDLHHEIRVHHLEPGTAYKYTVQYGNYRESYRFKTSPHAGSRQPFVFAFTSDCRAGAGGGERDVHGVNAYIMKKMAALAVDEKAAFFQFTGDMINGYSSSIGETQLQFSNFKRTIEPYWHYIPFYIGAGNHEAVLSVFDDGSRYGVSVDKFPFNTQSAERTFANAFVNPENGPSSEDGAIYDPKPNHQDFPPYKETVYYYTYDNVAMIVMNSNYWYTPSTGKIPEIGGNPHGYIMDQQLKWLEETIDKFESDPNTDHIFVTIHTPAFPNGGHANNDMWYYGNNSIRPTVSGLPLKKGIIERRDEFLDIIINKSRKVVALLCGDEHNYSRLKLTKKTPVYPENYRGKKLKVSRPFWQITNGSAGAPYYGQEQLPWSGSVEMFSTQYALMLFKVDGKKVSLRVVNPDTLEEIEEIVLKEPK
ncbi:MAG: metallophosphoesterase family protein [Bacteroidales bacterium]|nr:metallophosphoesterase family protein [Bacteroidales bacterium]